MTYSENLKGVSGIYCAIHRSTGICYVGSSINIGKRRYEHIYKARRGAKTRFARALREFGEDSFDFEVLERCEQESLLERERFYIILLGAAEIDGLNSRSDPCATYDFKASAVTRARISASKKGKLHTPQQILNQIYGQIGLKRSDEAKARISRALKGIRKSESHRANLSLSKTGSKQSAETIAKKIASMRGIKRSKESFEKRRQTLLKIKSVLGESYGRSFKPILATDTSGNVMHVFESLLEAVSVLSIPNTSLREIIKTGALTPAQMLIYYVTVVPEPRGPTADIPAPSEGRALPDHQLPPPETGVRPSFGPIP